MFSGKSGKKEAGDIGATKVDKDNTKEINIKINKDKALADITNTHNNNNNNLSNSVKSNDKGDRKSTY